MAIEGHVKAPLRFTQSNQRYAITSTSYRINRVGQLASFSRLNLNNRNTTRMTLGHSLTEVLMNREKTAPDLDLDQESFTFTVYYSYRAEIGSL